MEFGNRLCVLAAAARGQGSVLQILCKYYKKLSCGKSDLPVFLSLPQHHSFVCLYLLVWCNMSADKCALKLFPLHSFAGKLQADRYVQLASWHNCLPCTFLLERLLSASQLKAVRMQRGIGKGLQRGEKIRRSHFSQEDVVIRLLGQKCVSS